MHNPQFAPGNIPNRFNIADHLILPNLAPDLAGRPYLICGEETLTRGDLHRRANRFANALRREGIAGGSRMALLMRESLELPVCFWGAVRAGVVPVPLNTILPAGDYFHFLSDSQATVLVVDAALWPLVAETVPRLPDLRWIVLRTEAGTAAGLPAPSGLPALPTPRTLTTLEAVLAAAPETFESVLASPEAPAFWLYTSGSTGSPKAAIHRQGDMAFVAAHYLGNVLNLRPDDLSFSAPKMFFAYGLGNSLCFPLVSGSPAVIQSGPATAESCFATLERFRPTVFYAVPSLFNAMLNRFEDWQAGRSDPPVTLPTLDHLRLALSGGEVLPPGVYHRWRTHFGLPILDGLGSTEALHFYLSNTPEAHRPGSAGRIVPGYEVRLVGGQGQEEPQQDAPGRENPEETVGELWLRGGSVSHAGTGAAGTHNEQWERGDWLRTGDRLRRDGEGFYYYEGRVDDMLKVGGSWVSPAQVESVLAEHPTVAECAVVGRPGASGLTFITAYVVLRAERSTTADLAADLMAHAARRLPPFKLPSEIVFSTTLPKTASGKTRRFLLRQDQEALPPLESSTLSAPST